MRMATFARRLTSSTKAHPCMATIEPQNITIISIGTFIFLFAGDSWVSNQDRWRIARHTTPGLSLSFPRADCGADEVGNCPGSVAD